MKVILVTGPWSSGTSAVAGMLNALGVDGCGPYFRTNDERTRNSFESLAFREVVDSVASEAELRLTVPDREVVAALKRFRATLEDGTREAGADTPERCVFLKYPLSALMIPHIARVFDTRLVYVLRPLRDIEITRQRRGWGENFGAKGAQALYSRMFQVLIDLPIPTMIIRYPELLRSPEYYAEGLARMAGGSRSDDARVQAAAAFVRRRDDPAPGGT